MGSVMLRANEKRAALADFVFGYGRKFLEGTLAFEILNRSLAAMILAGAATSAMAQSATQTRLLSLQAPSAAGAPVKLRVEVDGLGGGAPTGWVSFWDGTTRIGGARLGSPAGAGQATLATGYSFSCALTAVGGVKCWGINHRGQVGDGTNRSKLTPVDVTGMTSGVVAIAAGGHHSCALNVAGGVKCWGENSSGQAGDGTTTNRSTPVAVAGLTRGVVAIGVGYSHSCALNAAGGVKCWGANANGQLGDGTTTLRATPVAVSGLPSGVIAIAGGLDHSCALTVAGGVKCWGGNGFGQLGDGTRTNRLTPVGVKGLSSGVIAITAGGYHSCALTVTGGVKCWGYNSYGQLGDGTTTNRFTPVAVTGLTRGVVAIAAGIVQSCALTAAGGVKCWGDNYAGQLGDGTATTRPTPVDVVGLTNGGVAIMTGGYHSCAMTAAGGLKCWGSNGGGQLGDGTTARRFTPVDTQNIASLVRARAEFTTPPLAAGMHRLLAYFGRDATHAPSYGWTYQWVR